MNTTVSAEWQNEYAAIFASTTPQEELGRVFNHSAIYEQANPFIEMSNASNYITLAESLGTDPSLNQSFACDTNVTEASAQTTENTLDPFNQNSIV